MNICPHCGAGHPTATADDYMRYCSAVKSVKYRGDRIARISFWPAQAVTIRDNSNNEMSDGRSKELRQFLGLDKFIHPKSSDTPIDWSEE